MKYVRRVVKDNDFGVIRILINKETNEVLFSGKDVALGFGFTTEPGRPIRNYCKNIVRARHISPGGKQIMNFINLDDISRIIPHAKFCDENVLFYAFLMNICEEAEKIVKDTYNKMLASKTIDAVASFCNEIAESGVGLEFTGLSMIMPDGKKIRLSGTADA